MISRNGIFWTGVAVIVVPFLGLPSSWKTIIFILIGLWLCVVSYLANRQGGERSAAETSSRAKSLSNSHDEPAKA